MSNPRDNIQENDQTKHELDGKKFNLDLSTSTEWVAGEDYKFASNPTRLPNGKYYYEIQVISDRMIEFLKTQEAVDGIVPDSE